MYPWQVAVQRRSRKKKASEYFYLCCFNFKNSILFIVNLLSFGQTVWNLIHLQFIFNLIISPELERVTCCTCACSSPPALSSAVSPLSPHGGALAQPPEIPGVVGMRMTEVLPMEAWRTEYMIFKCLSFIKAFAVTAAICNLLPHLS